MDSEHQSDKGFADGKSLRLLRPSIVVLCGPAACGKSTFAKGHFRPTQIISSDWARGLVSDDERDQRFNVQAFALVHFLIEQRITLNRLCVVDSTALTSQSRKELINLARKYQVPITLLFFNAPLEICIERDEKRERSVGRAVVERQYEAYQECRETIRQEGFDQVVELQDGDLEKIQIEILFRPVARPAQRPPHPDAEAPRRFALPGQPPRPRLNRPSHNGPSASTVSGQPGIQPAIAPQSGRTIASVSAPRPATPGPGEPSVIVAGTKTLTAAHPAATKPAPQGPETPGGK